MRAFLAVELPGEVRGDLAHLMDTLRTGAVKVSWVRPDNLHVTLRFLGDIGAPDVDRLVERLAPQYARCAPFRVAMRGAGAFPNTRQPSVLWVGVDDAGGQLAALNALAEDAAEHIGLMPERRAFRGHVTLGRVRDPRRGGALGPLLQAAALFDGGEAVVDAVVLMESELRPGGSVYTPVRRMALGTGRD